MRVLSPRIEPPARLDEGSTASTASRRPRSISFRPKASMKVDLPTPGRPSAEPHRLARRGSAGPATSAASRWSARVDSTRVIAGPARCGPLRPGERPGNRYRSFSPASWLRSLDCVVENRKQEVWDRGSLGPSNQNSPAPFPIPPKNRMEPEPWMLNGSASPPARSRDRRDCAPL